MKTEIRRNGSWIVFWIWLIFCFPIAFLYWLFKLRKIKIYKEEVKK